VAAGRSRFNLPVLPAGDFPVMSSDGLRGRTNVDVSDLIRLIDKTRFAISAEETRYYLNGLYVHTVVEDGVTKLRAVATDGSRLALAEMLARKAPPARRRDRAAQDHQRGPRLLDDAGEQVELQISPQKVRFDFGGAALTSKVIDGNFPDYARVIPKDNSRIVMVDAKLFAQASTGWPPSRRRSPLGADGRRRRQVRADGAQHGGRPGGRGAGAGLRRRTPSSSRSTPATCWTSPTRSPARLWRCASAAPTTPPWSLTPATRMFATF
jgi:hypothetical protein